MYFQDQNICTFHTTGKLLIYFPFPLSTRHKSKPVCFEMSFFFSNHSNKALSYTMWDELYTTIEDGYDRPLVPFILRTAVFTSCMLSSHARPTNTFLDTLKYLLIFTHLVLLFIIILSLLCPTAVQRPPGSFSIGPYLELHLACI